jgi:outer membrane protein OmpA-like peptidoglycan-associated protein
MKKSLITLSVLSLLLTSSSFAGDEYDYIPGAMPEQIADLGDDDKDGVINERDRCISTPRGAEVDNWGCESQVTSSQNMSLKILFANDSSEINPVFLAEIKSMSQFLKVYPETSIEIQGFASRVGSYEHNIKLSEARAEKVRRALIQLGIAPSRVTIVGYGDQVVEREGQSEVDHAINRRVTATVVGYDESLVREWTIFTKRAR